MTQNTDPIVKLEDIIPRQASFSLRQKPDVVFKMRPVSLRDEVWMKNTFGADLPKILEEMQMRQVCRIIFHLLEEESKEHFVKTTVTIINEEGDKVSETLGGAELLYALVSGFDEKMTVFQALLETIGISRPVQEKLVDAEKKKLQKLAENSPSH